MSAVGPQLILIDSQRKRDTNRDNVASNGT